MPPSITLHLRASDGATFDLTIPGVVLTNPPAVRTATAVLYAPQSVNVRSGGAWRKP